MANRIAIVRREKNLTQKELARKVGVTNVTVCLWETGSIDMPMSRLYEIARALGVDPRELLSENGEQTERKEAAGE